jgi:hypothetical protein
MDPYLEGPAIWPDFHATFLVGLRAELNQVLPPGYVARFDRHVWVDEPDDGESRLLGRPDLHISEAAEAADGGAATLTLPAPAMALLPDVERKGKPYLRIVDLEKRRVVSVIELLSPADKAPGKDRQAYLAKRGEYLASGTNLVEMDLLGAGLRAPLDTPWPPTEYVILVCPAAEFPRAGVWAFSVRDRLPEVPVPLRGDRELVMLALEPAFVRAYDEARFGEEVDYSKPPDPVLRGADADWARQLLADRRVR